MYVRSFNENRPLNLDGAATNSSTGKGNNKKSFKTTNESPQRTWPLTQVSSLIRRAVLALLGTWHGCFEKRTVVKIMSASLFKHNYMLLTDVNRLRRWAASSTHTLYKGTPRDDTDHDNIVRKRLQHLSRTEFFLTTLSTIHASLKNEAVMTRSFPKRQLYTMR